MPTYDYECDACGHSFEEWQSFKDNPLTKCPSCKKNKLRRLFGGGAAIIFKGSGFYETDYRRKDEARKNGTPADGDAKPAEPKAEAKAEGKAESARSESSTPAASSNGDGGKKAAGKAKKTDS